MEAVLSCYKTYNIDMRQNLSNDKFIALQNLSKNKNLIIQTQWLLATRV